MKEKGIPFTQYLLPNGKKREMIYEGGSEETDRKAGWLISEGCYFETEILQTGLVALYCYWMDEDHQLSMELSSNDGLIRPAIRRLVDEAYKIMLEQD